MYKKIGFKKSMRTMVAMLGLSLLLTAGLGATVSAAPPVAQATEMHGETGVLILSVVPDSPADKAGITRGDIVLAVDDEAIDSVETFAAAIGALAAGDEIVITVLHGDETLDLPTIVGERDGRTYLGVVPYAEEALRAGEANVDEAGVDEAGTEESTEGQGIEEGAADDDSADGVEAEDADGDMDADEAVDEADEGAESSEQGSLRSMMPFGQGGAMIAEVVEGGPAAEAGLMAGDLIVAVDGQELREDVDLAELIGSYAPGDEVTLTVTNIESNETMEVPVVLGAHPDNEARAFLGISYALAPSLSGMGDMAPGENADDSDEDAAPAESGSLRSMMPFGQGGAMIAEVVEGGPAAEAGLVAGDLIVAVDSQELSEDVDFAELIGSYAPGEEVTLTVTNVETNEKMEVPVVLGAHPDDDAKAFLGIAYVLAPALPEAGTVAPDDDADGNDDDANMSEDDEGDLDDDEAVEESGQADENAAPQSRYNRSGMAGAGLNGARVGEVVAGGPAAEAGLVAGDLIVAVDGEELGGANLGDLIAAYAPGDEVVLTVQHAGSSETVDIPVALGAHPDDAEKAYLGIAYMPVLNRGLNAPDRRYRAQPAPDQRQEPKEEGTQDEDGCFHGHEGCDGHHGFGEHGEHGDMMMPFFHHGLEDFDLDQLSQEDRDALQEMFPFLFPDEVPEGESDGGSGL